MCGGTVLCLERGFIQKVPKILWSSQTTQLHGDEVRARHLWWSNLGWALSASFKGSRRLKTWLIPSSAHWSLGLGLQEIHRGPCRLILHADSLSDSIVSDEWNPSASASGQLCKTSSGSISQGLNYYGKYGELSSLYLSDRVCVEGRVCLQRLSSFKLQLPYFPHLDLGQCGVFL